MKTVSFLFAFICLFSLNAQVQQLNLLSHWSDESLPGSAQFNNTYNEVWGFAVNDHEYAVLGSTLGTHIFDITDPQNIFLREFIEGATASPQIIHRDYHDFKGYLYAVADEGESTLQIIEISGLPENIEVVYDDDDIIERTHNIYIDTTASKLYALSAKGGDASFKAVKIYSLENPLDPVKIGQYGVIGGQGFGHVHDAYVENDTAFFNTGGDGLLIADFSGDDPVLIDYFSSVDYPESGYNHSGWLSEDGEYYYFADETHGTSMKVVKTNGLQDFEIIGTFDAGKESQFSIPHNQIVHCGFLYVSYYYEGIQIFDLADPENPENVYEYETSNIDPRATYEGAWGVYPFLPSGNIIVSDTQEGLFIFEGINSQCSTVSSIENENVEEFLVYPNPATHTFTLNTEKQFDKLEMYSVDGSTVLSLKSSSNTYNLPTNISSGMYFLKATSEGKIYQSRIVIAD